ncbi:MAG: transglycosylase domain-containing protein [Desulfobacteraceae bacterium]|nr:transglycosylase domain-containing protein [Desulfobacteraceae bacterium]
MNEKPSPAKPAPADGKKQAPRSAGGAGRPLDPRQQAIKYKAFKHTFSEHDLDKLDDKKILKKLKRSQHLEESYQRYLANLQDNPRKTFFWDNPFHRTLFLLRYWLPKVGRWSLAVGTVLLVINYIPGPTQHIVELAVARSLYDTAPISRLPESLESYAHSAKIQDAHGAIIKSYGKRKVTEQIPAKVRMALLACEDHYFLPHPRNPWYVNAFFIHAGVSWPNLLGAVKDTLLGRTRGASTIVMQNAKKIVGNTERNIGHKLEEIILSYMMVSKFGKEQNLDFYINTVPVGANIYGFPAAARNYFKKDLSELTVQQLVAIGSFIPNHKRELAFYEMVRGKELDQLGDLRVYAEQAMAKVNTALDYLRSRGEISEEEHRRWLLTDAESVRRIGFREFSSPLYGKEEWTSWNVIREVCARSYSINGRQVSGTELLLDEPGEVVIETDVNLDLVEKIKAIIAEFLHSEQYQHVLQVRNQGTYQQELESYRRQGRVPPYQDYAGFLAELNRRINVGVAMINQHGEIVAYVGGKEFWQNGQTEAGGNGKVVIDLMNKQARIAPCSSIKPVIAYYDMVAANATMDSTYADTPLEYKYVESAGRDIWLPRNWYGYDASHPMGKKYSLLEAQVISINTIFARLYTNRVLRDAMLNGFDEIGLDYNREDAKFWPFGIGASDVPVQQWLGIYNAFLDGYYREPAFVRRILVNGQVIYDHRTDAEKPPVLLFDAKAERETELNALYEVCNRGTPSNLRTQFRYGLNLVSGKTGTAPEGRSSLFVSHFNPYRDRAAHPDHTTTMIVAVTTNSGGRMEVGTSGQGPTLIAGRIYDYMFGEELRRMMNRNFERAGSENPRFRNNRLYLANVNRYMDRLLQGQCGGRNVSDYISGVDGYEEALQQILNSSNGIYTGRDDLFGELVNYYCSQDKVVKASP